MLMNSKISALPETDPALDQQQLYAIGLDHIRRASRQLWTDHNLHDPGITILELLCYTLTDLAYRAHLPVADLLATQEDNAGNTAQQFFTARQILPNRALTENDYRKLLIDLQGVSNAWLQPAEQRYFADTLNAELLFDDPRINHPAREHICDIRLQGLYSVLLEFDPNITTQAQRETICAAAMQRLQANRNLCTDFVGVNGVQDQYYTLCAELELATDADPNRVMATICFEIDRYLSPPVLNHSLADMLDRHHADGSAYTVAEIFEGPALQCGFIDDAELARAELRREIRLSDIISIIMDIAGVRAVRDILINMLDSNGQAVAPKNKWRMQVPAGKCPRLSRQHGRMVCYKRGMPVRLDQGKVDDALTALNDALGAKLNAVNEEDIPIPLGQFRDTGAYYSFQQHFPALYGLSEAGLPAGADKKRQALALQLKGYLLFFDQVMANYCAQLTHIRELFSRHPAQTCSYFTQRVDSFPDAARIYAEDVTAGLLHDQIESPAVALARRNRFLDHLLARVGEDFHTYLNIMQSAFGTSPETALATKYQFLQDCPRLGTERALACNYTLADAQWNSFNVSGLERRLARLLGIANDSRRNLGEVSYDLYTELDTTPGDEYRFRVRHPVTGKILLSGSTHYATPAAAHDEMVLSIEMAQRPEGYQRKVTADHRHYFNIIDASCAVIARRIEYFATAQEMNTAIDSLMNHLRDYYSGEGMYLIEDILLRPLTPDEPFMPICPGCSTDADPYSYRLHFILPAYAGRFCNMDFRRFVEETIRAETPAHLLPKICWISAQDMAMVESAYRDFLCAKTRSQAALIDALTRVKNVYPAQPLRDCDHELPSFILNRNALGSLPLSPDSKEPIP